MEYADFEHHEASQYELFLGIEYMVAGAIKNTA